MAKLRSQIIKQKVHVLNSDHLHVREGCGGACFPNEGGKKTNKAELMHPPAGHGKGLL